MTTLPVGPFQIICADPPWTFKNYNDEKATHWVGGHYSLMSLAEIKALPVADVAAKDCVLFLWATFPTLPSAFDVIKAWGLTYKTVAFTWIKKNKVADGNYLGMGYWTRSNAEICLLATRGKPHRISTNVRQIVESPIRGHSQKPPEVRDRIVELLGNLPRLEMFARERTGGWMSWGDEL